MAIKSIFFLTYLIQILVSDIIVNRPSNGTGPIIISDEDLENYYYNPDRILFVFNRSCIANIDEDDEELIQRINTIKDKYSDCMKETGNNRNKTSYDTAKYSYVFFDLLCSIYSLSENSSITIDYDDLCIAYIQYEPLFNVTQETESIQPQTVAINTPEFACMRGNTDYFESYGMDLLDSDKMDYRYSYPQFTNVTISNERKIDIYVLDSGIQSNHEEFENYQIIHRLGDGPAIYPNDGSEIQKYGDHGTHVAGLASGKNYGSSRNFTIFDYRVCEFTSNGQDMPCYGSLIFEALFSVWEDLKAKGKPSVINLSLGGPKSTSLDDAYQHYFEELIKVGGIPVVAAGI